MSAKPYKIVADPTRCLLRMSFDQVFWDDNVATNFIHDCVKTVNTLRCEPSSQLILVDLSNAVLQRKDVYDRMVGLVTGAAARRIALVAAEPLPRMQTKRLQVREGVRLFNDLTEAEGWLLEPEPAATAA